MIFPKTKMRLLNSYEGRASQQGWLELNVAAVDIEGASKILINLDDLNALQSQREKESSELNKARKLLGGD